MDGPWTLPFLSMFPAAQGRLCHVIGTSSEWPGQGADRRFLAEKFDGPWREQVEEAILVHSRLTTGRGRRHVRPPAWMTATRLTKRSGRPPGSKNKPKAE